MFRIASASCQREIQQKSNNLCGLKILSDFSEHRIEALGATRF